MTDKPESAMKQQTFQELMKRYHGTIENALYAAEQLCVSDESGAACYCGCPFYSRVFHREEPPEDDCLLPKLRDIIGDHFQQDDINPE